MPVPVDLIIFAIRGAFRLGRATSLELQAHIRNSEVALPGVLKSPRDPMATVQAALRVHPLSAGQKARLTSLLEDWEAQPDGSLQAVAKEGPVFEFAREVGAVEAADAAEEERGLIVIQQWSAEAEKDLVPPFARIGLALVEVALDYATTNPGVFGVGSNGERFISALASAIDQILPDSDKMDSAFKPEQIFGERAIAILAHNGLSALQGHIIENVDEDHLRDISVSMLGPLIENFKDGQIARTTLIEFRELLLGPMAREAIASVARHQDEFLGSRFGKHKALGTVTNAILVTLAEEDGPDGWSLEKPFHREVWTRVYGSVLDVAIERPELFVGKDEKSSSVFARDLVKTVAARLKDMRDTPFSESTAALIAADAIQVLSRNTAFLFDKEKDTAGNAQPWNVVSHAAISGVLLSISAGMKEGVANDGDLSAKEVFNQVFSEEQAGDLVRIVLDQAAKTPGMITGEGTRDEVKALMAGIARAVSDSNRNLLSSEDWLEVAAIVAEETAKNPGRLFKIVDANGPVRPEKEFAVRIIGKLLGTAAEDFRARGREKGSLLFGETLKEVVIETIELAAENAELVLGNEEAMINLVKKINELQAQSPQSFGRKEWLRLFSAALKKIALSRNGQAELDKVQNLKDLRAVAKQ